MHRFVQRTPWMKASVLALLVAASARPSGAQVWEPAAGTFDCPVASVYCNPVSAPLSTTSLFPINKANGFAERSFIPVSTQEPAWDLSWGDLLQAAPPDSLPENMPWNTRVFWGRRGLFRAIGLAPEHRSQELAVRRSMLAWHQRLGLLTWGMFTAQVITGQMIFNNPAEHYESLQPVHRTLGYTTWGSYLATASLSLLAPPGRQYGGGISSIKIHRYLAVIHFTGMMVQPWLGRATTRASAGDYQRLRSLHRTVGWVTYGAFSAAILSIVLPI